MPLGAASSCAVTMLIIQSQSCTTNVTEDWELILERDGELENWSCLCLGLSSSSSVGQTDGKDNCITADISQTYFTKNTHTYLTLREEYNNNWTQRRGGEKHNKHP